MRSMTVVIIWLPSPVHHIRKRSYSMFKIFMKINSRIQNGHTDTAACQAHTVGRFTSDYFSRMVHSPFT